MKILRAWLCFSCLLFAVPLRAQTPLLNIDPVLLDFGTVEVGASEDLTMKLTNLTAAPLAITNFSASGSGSFELDVNGGSQPCGSENPTIAANDFCTMVVTYAPTVIESASGSVSFTPNGQASSAVNARFLGEAVGVDNGGCALGGVAGSGAWWSFLPLLLGLGLRRISRNFHL